MKRLLFLLLVSALLSSCSEKITRGTKYSKLYSEKPTAIVVMPPINQTSNAEAKDFFYTTLYAPLCEKGYYVFSPSMTLELFENESAYDSEQFIDGDLSKFKSLLNADAAMFTTVKSWKKNVFGSVTVGIEYVLKSTATNEVLYKREGLVTVDTSVKGGSGLLGMAMGAALTAARTALTQHVEVGRLCNFYVLKDMPVGKYHPQFGQDAEQLAGSDFVRETVKK